MRYFLFTGLLLLTTALAAQEQIRPLYVWAKSGLSMRAEGKSGAEKILVVPFGASVRPTGNYGEHLQVTDLKSVSYPGYDGQLVTTDSYVMNEYFVEVDYQGQTGYVYGGYLSRYSPAAGSQPEDVYAWLAHHFGTPTETETLELSQTNGGRLRLMVYPKGAMVKYEEFEGGGGSTIIIPEGTLNEGYLIAARLMGIGNYVDDWETVKEEAQYFDVEFLRIQEDGTLEFAGDMSTTTIQVVGGLLIISGFGGC